MKSEVEFLGHRVTQHGVQPTEDKVRAINRAPTPTNVAQLRSFLGLMNYYSRFLSNLSSTLAPLYLLLQKLSSWFWGTEQQKAFESAKAQLSSDTLLVYYCGDKPLLLSCDASSYGLGAVLSHRMEDGSEKPIAYASRTLAPAEKRYAQIEKEGLAIVFGVTNSICWVENLPLFQITSPYSVYFLTLGQFHRWLQPASFDGLLH